MGPASLVEPDARACDALFTARVKTPTASAGCLLDSPRTRVLTRAPSAPVSGRCASASGALLGSGRTAQEPLISAQLGVHGRHGWVSGQKSMGCERQGITAHPLWPLPLASVSDASAAISSCASTVPQWSPVARSPVATLISSRWPQLPPELWSQEDVCDWVVQGMQLPPELGATLVREEVRGSVLMSLTELDLERMGVEPFGRRRQLMLGIRALRSGGAQLPPRRINGGQLVCRAAGRALPCVPASGTHSNTSFSRRAQTPPCAGSDARGSMALSSAAFETVSRCRSNVGNYSPRVVAPPGISVNCGTYSPPASLRTPTPAGATADATSGTYSPRAPTSGTYAPTSGTYSPRAPTPPPGATATVPGAAARSFSPATAVRLRSGSPRHRFRVIAPTERVDRVITKTTVLTRELPACLRRP